MSEATLRLTIDGHAIEARPGLSLIQAWIGAGLPLSENVGCMGQGVCGACRVLVRRPGERIAAAALACETRAEDGMQAAFVDHFPARRTHAYDLDTLADGWGAIAAIDQVFPEAKHCRHCGGCDAACPKGIAVQQAVNLAAEGRALAAGACSTTASCATSASPPARSTSRRPTSASSSAARSAARRCVRAT